jgi:polyphenol oxidase
MRTLRPVGFNSSTLLTALSTRVGGPPDSPFGMNLSFNVGDDPANVQANRGAFFNALRIKQEELAIPRQIHSSTVVRADSPGTYPDCDALVTDRPRVFLCVSTADCIPLFIYEKEKRVVAAIHSGWRGTVAAIAVQGVRKMVEEYGADPKAMCAYVGPAASVCCYAVSPDVASRFEPRFVREMGGNLHVDLKGTVLSQLLSVGIPPAAIDISPLCTISEAELFHSFRRDGARSGRMMGVTGLIR